MKIKINKKCNCGCNQKAYLYIKLGKFSLSWFTEFGFWFVYIHFGKRFCQFSSGGFLKGKRNNELVKKQGE